MSPLICTRGEILGIAGLGWGKAYRYRRNAVLAFISRPGQSLYMARKLIITLRTKRLTTVLRW